MIDGIGKSGAGRIDLQRSASGQAASSVVPMGGVSARAHSQSVGGAVGQLVSMGPPVDSDKVSAIRLAISQGRYAVDPEGIADRMVEADLGR